MPWPTRCLTGGVPLEDEPEAEWAVRVRERLEDLRQEARLELARDRSRGVGRARPEEVLAAWQACFEADPTVRRPPRRSCASTPPRPAALRRSLSTSATVPPSAALGLKTSPALEEAAGRSRGSGPLAGPGDGHRRPSPSAGPGNAGW